MYARAWECEYEKSILIAITKNPKPPEITVGSEEAVDEMSTTPQTIRENSPEVFPHADRSCVGTDTDHYMQLYVDTSVEQPDPCSSNYDLHHNPKSNCIDDYRY